MTSRRGGFTLLEILAALGLLAIVFTVLMDVRYGAIAKATSARTHSIATRLANTLLHRIEAGLVQDLDDGYRGDFSDQEYGDFLYVLAIGDNSRYSGGEMGDTEEVWRRFRENLGEESESTGTEIKPEFTRVKIIVDFPSARSPEERESIELETLVPTWAVEQDFQLYESLWPDLRPTAIQ